MQKKKRVGKRASDGTKDDENSRRRDDRELGGLGFGLLELLFDEFGDVGPGG
jgi:anti-sigma regulatory factor (Ser/Thr protein kinase)